MDIFNDLREIVASDELKTVTDVTESIKDSAECLLRLDETQTIHFGKFATSMDETLVNLVRSGNRRKSLTSKLDKLSCILCFMNFVFPKELSCVALVRKQ